MRAFMASSLASSFASVSLSTLTSRALSQRRASRVALVPAMALAATAAGADGIMIEVHNDPARALCDGAQSLTPMQFHDLCRRICRVREAWKA